MDTAEKKQLTIGSLPLFHAGSENQPALSLEICQPNYDQAREVWTCAVALRGDEEFHDWFMATGKSSLESLCKAVEVARLYTILTAERVGLLTTEDGSNVLENVNLFFQ